MALACMLARLFDLKNVWTERDIAKPVRFFSSRLFKSSFVLIFYHAGNHQGMQMVLFG